MTGLETRLAAIEARHMRAREVLGLARPVDLPDVEDHDMALVICTILGISEEHISKLAEFRFVARMYERSAVEPQLCAALRRAVEGLEAAARSDLDSVGAKRVLADLARLLGEGERG